MEHKVGEPGGPSRIEDLYPGLTETALREAEEALEDYIQSTLRLYERISTDPAAYEALQAALTARKKGSSMEVDRTKPAASQ